MKNCNYKENSSTATGSDHRAIQRIALPKRSEVTDYLWTEKLHNVT